MAVMELATPAFYHPRNPRESPLYRLLEEHYAEFERRYPEHYQAHYGFFRPVIHKAVHEFLKCGDLREGFARVRCPACRHEFYVAYSCKQRCVCPTCHQKRSLVTAMHIAQDISAPVPHRQFVFTMPKRFRVYFRFNRDLLRLLPPLAWETVRDIYRATLNQPDATPGMTVGIQTHGSLANWHPHLHAIVTDGAFTPDGTFLPMPHIPAEPFLRLWEEKLFALLLAEGRITPETVQQMRSWQHSGFSVDTSVRIAAGDTAAIERLTQYIVRCPFSLDRIISLTPDGKVIYRAENPDCRHFPKLGDHRLTAGVNRNFEVFAPLDFIAEITQHIPDPGAQQIRYYGWYSNAARGRRAKLAKMANPAPPPPVTPLTDDDEEDTPYRKKCRQRWAALIKKVYEINPLLCPKCGGQMKIITFLERRHQAATIQRILKHCGRWEDPVPHATPGPAPPPESFHLDPEYVNEDDFLAALGN